MKSIGLILNYLSSGQSGRNVRVLVALLGLLVVFVAVYSAIFHELMAREGQYFSWPTAVYWTLVTMSTLGFGDITFTSDAGRLFSVIVLLSGSVFILVLLPFAFIQFVFVPWMDARQRARAPRALPEDLSGHVLLTGIGPIEEALIRRLDRSEIPYAALIGDVDEALRLHDAGFRVMVGDVDDPAAFRAAQVDQAALVAATRADTTNTNVVFTVREISDEVSVIATANAEASVDILELAGADGVFQLGEMLGSALARRVLAPDGSSHVIGRFGDLLIAEAIVPDAMVGHPLSDTGLRQRTGVTVAGVWDRGVLSVARADTVVEATNVLVLAGSRAQLDTYDRTFGVATERDEPVVIIGGGRVGRAVSRSLVEAGVEHRIVEQRAERVRDPERYVLGDAAERSVLEAAGLDEARSVLITTHDDDVNVYLTIYCRRLRPDIQIIARARLDRNVSTLHRAGADAVLSYASTGANALWNVLSAGNTLQLAEGLDVFRVPIPPELAGQSLAEARIRQDTGCTVVAIVDGGRFEVNPDVATPTPRGCELVLIGDDESEDRFLHRYPTRVRARLRPPVRTRAGGSPR